MSDKLIAKDSLASIKDILSILICPKCNSKLDFHGEEIFCSNSNCTNNLGFILSNGQPVLVDFDESIFSYNSYKSTVDGSVLNRKRSSLHRFLSRLIWGSGKTASRNLAQFLKEILSRHKKPKILMVGGGAVGSGIEQLYSDPRVEIIGFDVYSSSATNFIADAHKIPLQDSSIDGVWIQYVLEHVLEPEKVISEVHRVLKTNGLVYAETPFMQQVHEQAYDFVRFTESAHRWLFRDFELIDSGSATGPGTVLVWSIRSFISALFRNKSIGRVSTFFFFWLRFFDYAMPKKYSSDGASSIFFMGSKSTISLKPQEIIRFYKGVN